MSRPDASSWALPVVTREARNTLGSVTEFVRTTVSYRTLQTRLGNLLNQFIVAVFGICI